MSVRGLRSSAGAGDFGLSAISSRSDPPSACVSFLTGLPLSVTRPARTMRLSVDRLELGKRRANSSATVRGGGGRVSRDSTISEYSGHEQIDPDQAHPAGGGSGRQLRAVASGGEGAEVVRAAGGAVKAVSDWCDRDERGAKGG